MEKLKDLKNRISDGFQLIGPSIMPVIAILPIAALMMGIGSALQQQSMIDIMPFLANAGVVRVSTLLNAMGNLIIGNLGLFFAVGIAMNLSGKSGMAALSSLLCFLVMHKTIELTAGITADTLAAKSGYANVLGIYTFQCGVFGGLLVGIVVAWLYNKYHEIELPQSLAFFQGERFIPIISVLGGIVLGLVMLVIWPPVQGAFNAFTTWLIHTPYRFLCIFLYGFVMRLVQAFGMQHLIYPFFYFQMGEYTTKAGNVVTGESSIFFAQMADHHDITVGGFMAGSYIATTLCLAIALAMYHCARPERKKKVKGVLLGAALTALFTGVTEPIEFSFLLISPMLWLVYSALVGLGYAVLDLLQVRLGTALAGNLLDYILYGILPKAHNFLLFIPVALIFFVAGYIIFKTYITKRDIKTIGREDESEIQLEEMLDNDGDDLPMKVLEYLGGASNVKSVTNCITRVRAKVYDRSIVNLDDYKLIGAKAVVTPGSDNVQLVYGGASERIANTIKHLVAGGSMETAPVQKEEKKEKATFKIPAQVNLKIPADGELITLKDLDDGMFSEKIVGDGFAIRPTNGKVYSPVNGHVESVFPTKHALGLVDENGMEVLIHMGIDTVELEGEGFELSVKKGDKIKAGDALASMDLETIKSKGKDTPVIIAFSNIDGKEIKEPERKQVHVGEEIQIKILK